MPSPSPTANWRAFHPEMACDAGTSGAAAVSSQPPNIISLLQTRRRCRVVEIAEHRILHVLFSGAAVIV